MEYMNHKALVDAETSLKFALFFGSRSFQISDEPQKQIRYAMMSILEQNFGQADFNRTQDRNRLYNSITMLGEYYNRARLTNNAPVDILGDSLIKLLIKEITHTDCVDVQLAKLILSQITINGRLLRAHHQSELEQLLYHIRVQLIEQPALKATVKALLLMTLDLYYSNSSNLGQQLDIMYTNYFVQCEQEAEAETNCNTNNNNNNSRFNEFVETTPSIPANNKAETETKTNELANGLNNDLSTTSNPQKITHAPMAKKWSEQVCEDAELEEYGSLDVSFDASIESNTYETERSEPRKDQPLYEPPIIRKQKEKQSTEEQDQNKPLPHWRSLRFNRDDNGTTRGSTTKHHKNRRFSGSNYDEDENSVRSEAGIRLYSINDRLKHSIQKMQQQQATSGTNQHYYNSNSIANSNWDRQSLQRDDRSERSYISNYERGNHHRRGNTNRYYNNKQVFDKPPRFQKQQQQQQQQQQHHNYTNNPNQRGDKIIHSDTWRRRNSHDYIEEYQKNGPESNSRSSSRARTLPRPSKAPIEGSVDGQTHIPSSSYRRRNSQSPHYARTRQFRERRGGGGGGSGSGNRYSSQSSLASEASSVYKQQQQQKHKNKNYQQQRNQNQNNTNIDVDVGGELVRNAQKTTKYMNYLSQK